LQFRRWKCNKRQDSERKAITMGNCGAKVERILDRIRYAERKEC
jgi:hypothetical protein